MTDLVECRLKSRFGRCNLEKVHEILANWEAVLGYEKLGALIIQGLKINYSTNGTGQDKPNEIRCYEVDDPCRFRETN